jgi:hypothetical protein
MLLPQTNADDADGLHTHGKRPQPRAGVICAAPSIEQVPMTHRVHGQKIHLRNLRNLRFRSQALCVPVQKASIPKSEP